MTCWGTNTCLERAVSESKLHQWLWNWMVQQVCRIRQDKIKIRSCHNIFRVKKQAAVRRMAKDGISLKPSYFLRRILDALCTKLVRDFGRLRKANASNAAPFGSGWIRQRDVKHILRRVSTSSMRSWLSAMLRSKIDRPRSGSCRIKIWTIIERNTHTHTCGWSHLSCSSFLKILPFKNFQVHFFFQQTKEGVVRTVSELPSRGLHLLSCWTPPSSFVRL